MHFGIVHAKGVAERKAYVRIQFKSGEVLLFQIQGSTGDEFISASAPAPPMKMEGWNSFVRKSGDSEEQVLVPSTKSLQAYEVRFQLQYTMAFEPPDAISLSHVPGPAWRCHEGGSVLLCNLPRGGGWVQGMGCSHGICSN